MKWIVALALIQFTGPTGFRIDVNSAEVSSVRDPHGLEGHWGKGVNCVLVMNNGRNVAVHETCDQARDKLRDLPGKPPCTFVCGAERR